MDEGGGLNQQLEPSLPTATDKPLRYLKDPNWGISQKVDGKRLLLRLEDGSTKGFNRNGDPSEVPKFLQSLAREYRHGGIVLLDGEVVGKRYYAFDVLCFKGEDVRHLDFLTRQNLLTWIVEKLPSTQVQHLKTSQSDKFEFFNFCQKNNAEGVVFNHLHSPYSSGRTKRQIKYKFTHTIDCIVLGSRFDDKDNLVLGLQGKDGIIECGRVSSLTGDGPRVKVGDVVEVTYLYATKGNRLYQPVRPKLRTDKSVNQCTLDQLDTARPNLAILKGD